jgi:hypothetical protein
MKTRVPAAAVVAIFAICVYYGARQARYWAGQELSPFHRFLDGLDARLPADARVLLLARPDELSRSHVYQLNARLHPRPVYPLPSGAATIEDARAWIAAREITWVVSLGGGEYNPRTAFVRRLDDGR